MTTKQTLKRIDQLIARKARLKVFADMYEAYHKELTELINATFGDATEVYTGKYRIKRSYIKECEVAFTRPAHWRNTAKLIPTAKQLDAIKKGA